MAYAIRCEPGGLLKDEKTLEVVIYDNYAEAEAEAQRLTREAYKNPRIAGMMMDFTPVLIN